MGDRLHITTSRADITPFDIRQELMSTGVPSGIEIISPDDAIARMIENGYDPRTCYAPKEVIEARLKDPYDLCSLTLFLEQIYAIKRRTMAPGEALFKVFGEHHQISAQIAVEASVMATHPRTVFCNEIPLNGLGVYARRVYDLPDFPLDPDYLEEIDPKGHLYAKLVIKKTAFHAPLAIKYLYQTALNSEASVHLVDAIRQCDRDYLDKSDPLVCEVVQARFGDTIDLTRMDLPSNSHTLERDSRGIIVRSGVMARRIVLNAFNEKALPDEEKGNIKEVQVRTGANHIATKIYGFSYEDSLPCMILKEAKAQGQKNSSLVSVFFERKGLIADTVIPRGCAEGHIPVIVRGFTEDIHEDGSSPQTQWDCLDCLAESFKVAGQTDHPIYQGYQAFKKGVEGPLSQPSCAA